MEGSAAGSYDETGAVEARRTAAALLRLDLEGRQADWLTLARGTEDQLGVMVSLSSVAAALANVVGQLTGTPALDAVSRLIDELGGDQ